MIMEMKQRGDHVGAVILIINRRSIVESNSTVYFEVEPIFVKTPSVYQYQTSSSHL